MKFSYILSLLPLIAPVSCRTKEQWVKDLQDITTQYDKLVAAAHGSGPPSNRVFLVEYSLEYSYRELNDAEGYLLTSNSPMFGEHVDGGSCYAMAEYFPKVAEAGVKAMNELLDPAFACEEDNKSQFRNKFEGIPEILPSVRSSWNDYHDEYFKSCAAESGAKVFLNQEYQPLKKAVQKANDAYEDIDAYCKSQQ